MKLKQTLLAAAIALATSSALAAPITFNTSTGTQPANVGIITLTQVNADTVNVDVDLLPGYGFLNTGSHTPFTFQLAVSGGLSITFTNPLGGSYVAPNATNHTFSLNTAGGSQPNNTANFTFNTALDISGGNGSANAYFGDLTFNLTRTGLGLLTTDFVANPGGFYFSADLAGLPDPLTGDRATGAQFWSGVTVITHGVPEPETYAMLLAGLGLMGFIARRRRQATV